MSWLARRITTPATLLAVVGVWFVFVLGWTIASGELLRLAERGNGSTSFDSSITSWVVAHRAHGATILARWLSALGSQKVLLPVVVIVALLLFWQRQFVLGGALIVAWGGSIGLYNLAKDVVGRHRPPVDIWLTGAAGASFPSGHAVQSLSTMIALALVGAVWLLPRARGPGSALALVLSAGVGWSRVYLGVHWATDVVAGWLIAAAWVSIVMWLALTGPAKSIEERLRARHSGQP